MLTVSNKPPAPLPPPPLPPPPLPPSIQLNESNITELLCEPLIQKMYRDLGFTKKEKQDLMIRAMKEE